MTSLTSLQFIGMLNFLNFNFVLFRPDWFPFGNFLKAFFFFGFWAFLGSELLSSCLKTRGLFSSRTSSILKNLKIFTIFLFTEILAIPLINLMFSEIRCIDIVLGLTQNPHRPTMTYIQKHQSELNWAFCYQQNTQNLTNKNTLRIFTGFLAMFVIAFLKRFNFEYRMKAGSYNR